MYVWRGKRPTAADHVETALLQLLSAWLQGMNSLLFFSRSPRSAAQQPALKPHTFWYFLPEYISTRINTNNESPVSAQNSVVIYDDSTNLSFAFLQFGLLPFMAPIQDFHPSCSQAHSHKSSTYWKYGISEIATKRGALSRQGERERESKREQHGLGILWRTGLVWFLLAFCTSGADEEVTAARPFARVSNDLAMKSVALSEQSGSVLQKYTLENTLLL